MGRGSNSAGIVGRDRELAQISTALSPEVADLLVLALLGDAGIGKTVLLDAAIDRSRDNGVHILRGRGSTAETLLAFAGLHQVLFPVLDRAGEHDRQRRLGFADRGRGRVTPLKLGQPVPNVWRAEIAESNPSDRSGEDV